MAEIPTKVRIHQNSTLSAPLLASSFRLSPEIPSMGYPRLASGCDPVSARCAYAPPNPHRLAQSGGPASPSPDRTSRHWGAATTAAGRRANPNGGRRATARHSSARLGSVGNRSSGHRADGEVESRGEGALSGGLRVATAARLESSDGRADGAEQSCMPGPTEVVSISLQWAISFLCDQRFQFSALRQWAFLEFEVHLLSLCSTVSSYDLFCDVGTELSIMNPYLRQLKKFTCTKILIASPKILGPPLLAGGGEEAAGDRECGDSVSAPATKGDGQPRATASWQSLRSRTHD